MNPIATTALLVAAIRAEESKRADRWFDDPFAEALSGQEGREALAKYRAAAAGTFSVPVIEVRTRWYDEALARACAGGIRQFVILAAGMDTRAFRLRWPEGTRVFELDQVQMIANKDRVLASAVPNCERTAIGLDLAEDWPALLTARGFEREARTAWMVEGVLQYVNRPLAERIFERIDALSIPGSLVINDVVGQSMLDSPMMASTLKMMAELGAPWSFGSDQPAEFLPAWSAAVTEPAIVGNNWKRWPFPAAPAHVQGIPRGYFVEAIK
jgi:methyltransferase (TIGR00027 family)